MIVRPAPETCAWLVPSALAAAGPDTEAIRARARSAPKSLNFDHMAVVLLQKPSPAEAEPTGGPVFAIHTSSGVVAASPRPRSRRGSWCDWRFQAAPVAPP